jgi:hypothetical protein
MDTKELRELTERFGLEQLEACIQQQISQGSNTCGVEDEQNEVLAALSKAEVVREIMETGLTFPDALRELGRRMRAVYGKEDGSQ